MSPMEPDTSLPFFFYGTLMEGCGNDRMLPPLLELRERATITGYHLHYARPRFHGYPVVRRLPNAWPNRDDYSVHGEVVWLDVLHPEVQAMADMEIGAGYRMRPVSVTTESGLHLGALVFEASEDWHSFGEFIPSGNWRSRG